MSYRIPMLLLLIASAAAPVLADGGLVVSAGPVLSNLSPESDRYRDRFLTPGTSAGLAVELDAPGALSFLLTGEYFWKGSSPSGWDGELDAVLVSAMPVVQLPLVERFGLFAGGGAVYVSGSYSGTDDFGNYVEASGSTVGFGLTVGLDVSIVPPLSGRLEYRHAFADLRTDRADIDGQETSIYPAVESDLGYSQLCLTFPLSVLGEEGSVLR